MRRAATKQRARTDQPVAGSGTAPCAVRPAPGTTSTALAASESKTTEVLLLPAGTFVSGGGAASDIPVERRRQLALAIRQRIESRLGGRVRELAVRIVGESVVLEGRCTTYHTKQLAQHAAIGVLEDEHLENAIVVELPR